MAAGKDIFLAHMSAFGDAINHESIVEREPNQHRENARARVMRNGLAVICFSILEEFFRLRAKEVLSHIGRTGIPFENLPEELRRILTVKALSAAVFHVRLLKPNRDDVVFAQEIAQQIASTSGSPL
jgi:hypothetical protein